MKDTSAPSKDMLGSDPLETRLPDDRNSCGIQEAIVPHTTTSSPLGQRMRVKGTRRKSPKYTLEIGFMLIAFSCLTNCAFAQHSSFAQGTGYGHFPAGQHRQIAANDAAGSSRGGPPANDDCSNAQVIALALDCFAPINGDNSAATSVGPDASCDDPGGTLFDVWYTFTTGAGGTVAISLIGSAAMTDRNYVLYQGACDGTEVACRIAPPFGQQEPLLPATQYWLRVYSNPGYGDPGPFTLCIQDVGAVPAPPNDDCANVTPSALAVGGSVTFTGDATYALNSEGLPYNSIWNAFTTSQAADVHVSLCAATADLGLFWLGLYASCPADIDGRVMPGSYTFCANGLADLCFGNLPAGTYYYAVSNALSAGTYSVVASAEAAGTNAPANDECTGAIALSTGLWCSPTTFSPTCASASPPAGGCLEGMANPEDDTWYSFVATAQQMAIGIFPHSAQFGPIMEVYSGSCGAFTSIGCSNGFAGDTLQVTMNALVPGTVYYVQVYNGYLSGPTTEASYGLCVVEGATIFTGMDDPVEQDVVFIYPNPSDGFFSVRVSEAQKGATISVLDALGRTVLTERHARGGPITIDARGRLLPGTYILRVEQGDTVAQQRLVVQ